MFRKIKKYQIVNLQTTKADIDESNQGIRDEIAECIEKNYSVDSRFLTLVTEEQQAVLFYIQSIADPKTGFYTQSLDEIATGSGIGRDIVESTIERLHDIDFGTIILKVNSLNKLDYIVADSPDFLECTDWFMDDNGEIIEIKPIPEDEINDESLNGFILDTRS